MTIPTGYYEAVIRYDVGVSYPDGAAWTFGGRHDAVAATAQDVADLIATAIDDADFAGRMSDTTGFDSVLVKFGPDADGPSATASIPIAGTIAQQTEPPQVALLVRKNTNAGGRRGRGRMFVPGLPEGDVDTGGNLRSGVEASWQAVFDSLFDDLAAANVPMYLLHNPATHWVLVDGQPRRVPNVGAVAPAPSIITSLDVQPVVATQRRRRGS